MVKFVRTGEGGVLCQECAFAYRKLVSRLDSVLGGRKSKTRFQGGMRVGAAGQGERGERVVVVLVCFLGELEDLMGMFQTQLWGPIQSVAVSNCKKPAAGACHGNHPECL
jgi:hypothetical protein